eukprot:TRINITY_DN84440_c0_g1_i1.p1 TRINITY_DN84440_c0_g1~~TRINITY_DN84440_c0_g1_i1.p1  ORF type:complete len:400 (+),score=64.04 TRINITY_DN84440_c0_g1_i1:41-1240(+)
MNPPKQQKTAPEVVLQGATDSPTTLKIVHISDTHNDLRKFAPLVANGDVLVHSGDFTDNGTEKEVKEFASVLASMPHKHKIVICGNHEMRMDKQHPGVIEQMLQGGQGASSGIIYLQDTSCVVGGVKFYGTPWNNISGHGWGIADQAKRQQMFNLIHRDTDVLITHQPPYEIRDQVVIGFNKSRWGDPFLRHFVENEKVSVHLFGHVHEEPGVTSHAGKVFVNGAMAWTSGNSYSITLRTNTDKAHVYRRPLYFPKPIAGPPPSGGVVSIKNIKLGLVLDVDWGKKDSGTPVILWKYTGNNNQKWVLEQGDSVIKSQMHGLVIDINTHSAANELTMYPFWGGYNQRFCFDAKTKRIQSCMDGRFLVGEQVVGENNLFVPVLRDDSPGLNFEEWELNQTN